MNSLFSDSIENKESHNSEEVDKDKEVQIKKILVPIDGSAHSIRAERYAIEIAKIHRAQILCIHVIEPFPYSVDGIFPTLEEYSKKITNQAQQWFEAIIKIAKKEEGIDDIKTEVLRDSMNITIKIIKYASDNSIDLIVLGTQGRTGLKRLLLGSIANSVTYHAHCPVLLVR